MKRNTFEWMDGGEAMRKKKKERNPVVFQKKILPALCVYPQEIQVLQGRTCFFSY